MRGTLGLASGWRRRRRRRAMAGRQEPLWSACAQTTPPIHPPTPSAPSPPTYQAAAPLSSTSGRGAPLAPWHAGLQGSGVRPCVCLSSYDVSGPMRWAAQRVAGQMGRVVVPAGGWACTQGAHACVHACLHAHAHAYLYALTRCSTPPFSARRTLEVVVATGRSAHRCVGPGLRARLVALVHACVLHGGSRGGACRHARP